MSMNLLIAGVALAIGMFAVWALGAFRARSVAGESRRGFDPDFAASLWGIGFIGLGAWMFVPSLYVTLAHRPISPTTMPTSITAPVDAKVVPTTQPGAIALSSKEQVVLGASAQIAGLIALLAGDLLMLGKRAARLGASASNIPLGIGIGLLGACAAVPLTFAVSALAEWVSSRIGHPIEPHALLRIFDEQRHTIVPLLVAISAVCVAPVFEEFLFRGHLQTALLVSLRMLDVRPPVVEALWPRWTAIIIAAAIFAAIHGSAWMFFPLLLLAICNGYAYERTGNLWVPITMHATFNAVSLSLAWWRL